MTEASLAFSSPDQILLLFGAQDKILRQVRDAVGVDVTLRGDEIRLHGTEDQIKRGLAVFGALQAILEKRGELLDAEVEGVLGINGNAAPLNGNHVNGAAPATIDLLAKAPRVDARTQGHAEQVR